MSFTQPEDLGVLRFITAGSVDARFTQIYNDIKNPANGYFSPEGVPYHSIETLIDEAPDQGHETTSEAFSYWLWLEAEHGQSTQDWAPFNAAWSTFTRLEAVISPYSSP